MASELHRWTDATGLAWECDADDHGPFCRQCRPEHGFCAHNDGVPAVGRVPCRFPGGKLVDLGFCGDHWPNPEPRPGSKQP